MNLALEIICAVAAFLVLAYIVLHFGFGIFTQHRDHGVVTTGPAHRRWMTSSRPPRAHAGPLNPEAIPGATTGDVPADAPAPHHRAERPARRA